MFGLCGASTTLPILAALFSRSKPTYSAKKRKGWNQFLVPNKPPCHWITLRGVSLERKVGAAKIIISASKNLGPPGSPDCITVHGPGWV